MDNATAAPARVDRYAAALLEIARAEGEEAGLTDEIYAAARALAGNTELTDVLADPRIPHDRKRDIIEFASPAAKTKCAAATDTRDARLPRRSGRIDNVPLADADRVVGTYA